MGDVTLVGTEVGPHGHRLLERWRGGASNLTVELEESGCIILRVTGGRDEPDRYATVSDVGELVAALSEARASKREMAADPDERALLAAAREAEDDKDRSVYVNAVREQAFRPAEDASDYGRYPGGIVHSLLGGLGADWDADAVVKLIATADKVEWIPAPFTGHQLRVVTHDGRGERDYRFAVRRP